MIIGYSSAIGSNDAADCGNPICPLGNWGDSITNCSSCPQGWYPAPSIDHQHSTYYADNPNPSDLTHYLTITITMTMTMMTNDGIGSFCIGTDHPISCGTGTTSPINSTSASNCSCSAQYYGPNGRNQCQRMYPL
jgi:hypothetical protein